MKLPGNKGQDNKMKKIIETLKNMFTPTYDKRLPPSIPPLSRDWDDYERQLELYVWQSGRPYL